MRAPRSVLTAAALAAVAIACGHDATTAAIPTAIPAPFDQFTDSVEMSVDGDYIVIRTTDVPDHPSPYFSTSDPRYEAYNGSNPAFVLNPNRILSQQLVFRIPLHPQKAAASAATPLGPIGIALNGVAFFNQYAGPGQPLTSEINSFDQGDGHPQQTGVYHYHAEPFFITSARGSDALLGFLLDGFPVYGPMENGKLITNADLDAYHGHFGPTKEYPNGIYHYHVTATAPYINGAGFYGTAGTVSGG